MPVPQQSIGPWSRRHDMPGIPVAPNASIVYPQSLEDLIAVCGSRAPGQYIKAAGSHWALSPAAISDGTFIETHDPNDVVPAMGRTLYDVVPKCLNKELLDWLGEQQPRAFELDAPSVNEGVYFVHVESGKRIYQLYAELDQGEEHIPESLASYIEQAYGNLCYRGPWAFPTLGGAGGQTVFGALTTGTHGGDIKFPPVCDAVVAMHLVADGGKHYWIERESLTYGYKLTDDTTLKSIYGTDQYGGERNFEIIRDDTVFDAVLVSAGRFGAVYSIILRVVRQYSLHEERRLACWQDIKHLIPQINHDFYTRPSSATVPATTQNRFLQIVVSLTPHANFQKNLCGITKRWNVGAAMSLGALGWGPIGRSERVGQIVNSYDPIIKGTRFSQAGNSHSYSNTSVSFLDSACTNASFMAGIVEEIRQEVKEFVDNNQVAIGSALAAVSVVVYVAVGASGLWALAAALGVLLLVLDKLLDELSQSPDTRLGQTLDHIRDELLNRADPAEKAAGILLWQCLCYRLFQDQQGNLDFEAISYAVMDKHDYLDKSCTVNGDSIEVFFDATDPMLIAYVDALIAYETRQEFIGKAFLGYVSLRFTGPTQALLGMERFPVTCAVEVSGLKDVVGTKELMDFAHSFALNKNVRGILHWGQRNQASMADTEDRFGDSLTKPGGALGAWRRALSSLTENGRLNGFSSAWTRAIGLEVVTPMIGFLRSMTPNPSLGQTIKVAWNNSHNPAGVETKLDITSPSLVTSTHNALPASGSFDFVPTERGEYKFTLTASIKLNGERRDTTQNLLVTVP